MEEVLKVNHAKACQAMTKLLVGKPGGLIPICTSNTALLTKMKPNTTVSLSFNGKRLTVYIGSIASNIETRDLWLLTYLQSMK